MKRFLTLSAIALSLAGTAIAQETTPQPQPAGAVITLHTTMGDIEVTLDPIGAPKTAAQFLGLVKSGHYDGAVFYRIEPGFVIQFGDLDAKLEYRVPKLPPIPLETATNNHSRGALSLARADELDSGQSTIFISLAENSGLDATPGAPPNTTGYAAFGLVTAGMDVVDAIASVELASEGGPFPGKLPKQSVVVTKAEIANGN